MGVPHTYVYIYIHGSSQNSCVGTYITRPSHVGTLALGMGRKLWHQMKVLEKMTGETWLLSAEIAQRFLMETGASLLNFLLL